MSTASILIRELLARVDPPASPTAWILAILAAACAACGAPGSKMMYDEPVILEGSRPGLFDLEDYFAAGEQRLARYLATRGDEAALRRAREMGQAACVRIWFLQATEVETRGQAGSGVLIEPGGFVVTASHTLPRDGEYRIEVLLASGRKLVAREVPSPAPRLWALFRLEGEGLDDLPRVAIGRPGRGRECWILGYPNGQIGWADGRIMADAGSSQSALAPIALLGRLEAGSPMELSPLAGTMGQSGMSGGAIVDADGRLVGVIEGTTTAIERDGVRVSILANSLDGLEELVHGQNGEVRP